MGRIFWRGEEVKELPESALQEMSERLSYVVSTYFSQHPDEYKIYLESKKKREEEAESNATAS